MMNTISDNKFGGIQLVRDEIVQNFTCFLYYHWMEMRIWSKNRILRASTNRLRELLLPGMKSSQLHPFFKIITNGDDIWKSKNRNDEYYEHQQIGYWNFYSQGWNNSELHPFLRIYDKMRYRKRKWKCWVL